MRFSTSAAALSAITLAAAQTVSPTSIATQLLGLVSTQCAATLIGLESNSTLVSCLDVQGLLPILTTTGSILQPLDSYLATTCGSTPCTNDTITAITQTVMSGCGADLSNFGISNGTLEFVMSLYPLAREVACLKTSQPYSPNGTVTPAVGATIGANMSSSTTMVDYSSYNSTNGTFCVTSELTKLETYLGVNFTNSFIDTAVLGGNSTALNAIYGIPMSSPALLCSDCIFGAVDIIEQSYPMFGDIKVGQANMTMNATTINTFLDGACNAFGYNVTENGTLPMTVEPYIFTSSYAFNLTNGNFSFTAPPDAVEPLPFNMTEATGTIAPQAVSSIASLATGTGAVASLSTEATSAIAAATARALKARWIGQQ